jgi:AcrR family transcriptional regulator
MSHGVKARATRRRITDAATELFLATGYGTTTLEQIAERAGVAVQTVYFHFGNKRTVLKESVDIAAVGDDEPVPLLDRPWLVKLRAEPDARRVIALWVRSSREIFGRIAPIMQVVRDAAGADPDMAEQWATNREQRLVALRVLAELVADRGRLRPGLTIAGATDVIYTLLSIEVYSLLTADRGWSPARWQRWMADTLADALLAS